MHWWAAQSLVEAGYVALTFDVRGQGRSDFTAPGGQPGTDLDPTVFYREMVDAIDFLQSSPEQPYPHDAVCGDVYPTNTAPHNPFAAVTDGQRIGLAGHSTGGYSVAVVQALEALAKKEEEVFARTLQRGPSTAIPFPNGQPFHGIDEPILADALKQLRSDLEGVFEAIRGRARVLRESIAQFEAILQHGGGGGGATSVVVPSLFVEITQDNIAQCRTHLRHLRLGALNGRRKKRPPAQGWEADENQSPHGLSLLGAGTAALAARRGEAGL